MFGMVLAVSMFRGMMVVAWFIPSLGTQSNKPKTSRNHKPKTSRNHKPKTSRNHEAKTSRNHKPKTLKNLALSGVALVLRQAWTLAFWWAS